MQNKKIVILIILGIVAIFSLLYGITSPAKTRYGALPRSSSQTALITTDSKAKVDLKTRARSSGYEKWGRSPFTQGEVRRLHASGIMLNGIIWDEKNPKAIINNEIVGKGDSVGKSTITQIRKDSVVISDGHENLLLRLHQEN